MLIISAGGIALFTALGVGAYFGSLYGPDRKQYEAIAGDKAGQNDYQGPSQSLPDISGLPGPVERSIANPRPQGGQDHEKRDLAAQEASALWAFWMVVASFLSILITTIGTILLYQQIKLTREAVQDTGDATKAMRDANVIAREIGQGQVRAYVHIDHATVKFYGNLLAVEMTFKNTGQSPAQKIEVELSPCVWIWAKQGPAIKESPVSCELDKELQYCGALGATSSVKKSVICVTRGKFADLFFKLSEPERRREIGPTALVHFVLRWWDVFDNKQETFGSISAHRFKWGKVFDREGLISTDAEPRHVGSKDEWLEQARKATEGRANHERSPVTDT